MSAGRQSGQRIRGYQRQHLNILGLQGDTQLCSLSLAHTHTHTHTFNTIHSVVHFSPTLPTSQIQPFLFLNSPDAHVPHSPLMTLTSYRPCFYSRNLVYSLSNTHTHRIRTPASWCNTVGIQRRGGGLNTSSRCYEEELHTHQRGVT